MLTPHQRDLQRALLRHARRPQGGQIAVEHQVERHEGWLAAPETLLLSAGGEERKREERECEHERVSAHILRERGYERG